MSNKEGYKYSGTEKNIEKTKTVYKISSDDFDGNKEYYSLKSGKYSLAKITSGEYKKNTYYTKEVIDFKDSGYPFRWPLYEDPAFDNLDFEANFFMKDTFGLNDSATVYDENEDNIASSFGSQTLEGLMLDTIAKLSFLRSIFNKSNHTFNSSITWFFPYLIDNINLDKKYDTLRMDMINSISGETDKIYSAFMLRDNKISELGSLYYNAYKSIFFKSNFYDIVLDSVTSLNSDAADDIGKLLRKNIEDKKTGIGNSNGIKISFKIGDGIHEVIIPYNEETLKRAIFLMSQAKLCYMRNLLDSNKEAFIKKYKVFFAEEFLKKIDISTEKGLNSAKSYLDKYILVSLTKQQINLLVKFSMTPIANGEVKDYIRLGSYESLVSEVKSLRAIETVTKIEINNLINLFNSFNPPSSGSKTDVNGDNAYRTCLLIEKDLYEIDSFENSSVKSVGDWAETYSNGGYCQTLNLSTSSMLIDYNLSYTSKSYGKTFISPSIIKENIANARDYVKLINGLPNIDNKEKGTWHYDILPNSTAKNYSSLLFTKYPTQAVVLSAYYTTELAFEDEEATLGIDYPDTESTIFKARCYYLLEKGYTQREILEYYNYKYSNEDTSSSDSILWSDYSLIDYTRAAAYGEKNITFFSVSAYKDFNNISVDIDYYPLKSIVNGLSSSKNIINGFDTSGLKIVWPDQINSAGQNQESLTYPKNDLNRFIDRTFSDLDSDAGDTGTMYYKDTKATRLEPTSRADVPQITVSDFKKFLKGDKDICDSLGVDANLMKNYSINLTEIENATRNDVIIPIIEIGDELHDLYYYRELQEAEAKKSKTSFSRTPVPVWTPFESMTMPNCYNSFNLDIYKEGFKITDENDPHYGEYGEYRTIDKYSYVMHSVCDASRQGLIYDFIKQGLKYEEAKKFADALLYSGDIYNVPVFGLLDESKFGTPTKVDDTWIGSSLEGFTTHIYNKSTKKLTDFYLDELYSYNNIDKMLLSEEDDEAYYSLLSKIGVIKDYVEMFFSHTDKIFKDISFIDKKDKFIVEGTTYIDDAVSAENVEESIKNTYFDVIKPYVKEEVSKIEDNFSKIRDKINENIEKINDNFDKEKSGESDN
ncbi:MAG: hypothetical protein HUJ68_08370, partial [Clostridia bacterium]|nr:hypothetical protein [Clostridia bacterium]